MRCCVVGSRKGERRKVGWRSSRAGARGGGLAQRGVDMPEARGGLGPRGHPSVTGRQGEGEEPWDERTGSWVVGDVF